MTLRRGIKGYVAMAYAGLSVVAAIALMYLVARILLALASGAFQRIIQVVPVGSIALAAAVYIFGHIFRSMRLALLIGGWSVGLRLITSFHFMTAGVSLAMPLKLGEFYRVAALSRLIGSFTLSVEIVWWERVLDVIALIIIMMVAFRDASSGSWHQFADVIVLAVSFIAISVLVFFVLPDNLRRTSVLIIRRYDSPRTVPILRILERVRRSILEAPRMVRGKKGSLAALTMLIWACEVGTFAILLAALGKAIADAPDALLGLLSVLTRGQTLAGVMDSNATAFGGQFLPYFAATQAPLALFGLFAGIIYTIERMRQ